MMSSLRATRILFFVAAVLFTCVGPARAAANRWSSVGIPAARVKALVADSNVPGGLWAIAGHRLYRSGDGGASWQERMDGLPKPGASSSMVDLVLDPSQSGTALLITNAYGLWRTVDGGASWTRSLGPTQMWSQYEVAADPFVAGTFYLASHSALLRSTDHGQTWQTMGVAPSDGDFDVTTAMAVDPVAPGTIYLVRGFPAGSAFVATTDYGATWQTRGAGLPVNVAGPLRAAADSASTLYVGAYGLHLSIDGGLTWQSAGLATSDVMGITVDPVDPTVVYALGADEQIFRTGNAGASWQTLDGHLGGLGNYDLTALAVDPADTTKLWLGTSQFGLLASGNGGADWALSNSGMASELEVCGLAIAQATHALYAVGGWVLWKSDDDGASWVPHSPEIVATAPFPRVADLALDPVDAATIYAATTTAGVFKSQDGGLSWASMNNGLSNLSIGSLAVDPTDSLTLYAGSGDGLFRSTDAGALWTLQNQDLDSVSAIDVDPSLASTLYFNGGTLRSSDFGATAELTPPVAVLSAGGGFVSALDTALGIDPTTPGRVYLGLDATVMTSGLASAPVNYAEFHGSTDYLQTTSLLGSFAPTALAVDPNDSAIVYAGRLYGPAERSLDHGSSFSSLDPSMRATVCDLVVDAGAATVYAGTRLSDSVTTAGVRELTPVVCTTNADCDSGAPCFVDTCEAGMCASARAADDTVCTISAGCGVTGTCLSGSCNQTADGCDDANACTDDLCAVSDVCAHYAELGCVPCQSAVDCDDGDGCTTDLCSSGVCVHQAVVCDDDDPCTVDSCEADHCVAELDPSQCGEEFPLLYGGKLGIVQRKSDAALTFTSRVTQLPVPLRDSFGDPTAQGMTVDVFNPGGGVTHFTVPSGEGRPGWSVGGGATLRYRYVNGLAPGGPSPMKKAQLGPGKLQIKVQGGVTLPDLSATRVGIRIASGNIVYCALMETDSPSPKRFKATASMIVTDCSDASLTP